MDSHPVFQPSSSKSFFQNMTDKTFYISQYIWLAIVTAAIIYIYMLFAHYDHTLMLARITTVQAYATITQTTTSDSQSVDILQTLRDNRHLLSMAIIILSCFGSSPKHKNCAPSKTNGINLSGFFVLANIQHTSLILKYCM